MNDIELSKPKLKTLQPSINKRLKITEDIGSKGKNI